MSEFPSDIYTEPSDLDGHTLANLGPLRRMAGLWRGEKGVDVKPKAQGPKTQVYVEHYELQPIDPQTNGPQVLYGLRYHTYIHKPGLTKMYHDQVGYWLWEPATCTVMHTLAIPRGQIAMASGKVAADADRFELVATRGSLVNAINPSSGGGVQASSLALLQQFAKMSPEERSVLGFTEDYANRIAANYRTAASIQNSLGSGGGLAAYLA